MRREFPAKIKLAAWDRCKGICEACRLKIIGRAEYDHRVPCALGGEPTLENCECLCAKCHRRKTSTEDVPRISKAVRTQLKFIGAVRGRGWPKRALKGAIR